MFGKYLSLCNLTKMVLNSPSKTYRSITLGKFIETFLICYQQKHHYDIS